MLVAKSYFSVSDCGNCSNFAPRYVNIASKVGPFLTSAIYVADCPFVTIIERSQKDQNGHNCSKFNDEACGIGFYLLAVY